MILETATRNALADALDTIVNTGAGTANIKFETSADVEVATVNLPNPAFGASSGGTITLQGVPLSDTSATGGTVAQASLYDRSGTKVLEMSAGTSGTNVIMSSVSVGPGDTVELTSLTITVPAGS